MTNRVDIPPKLLMPRLCHLATFKGTLRAYFNFSAENIPIHKKLKYALRVPKNGVSGSKKTFKGTLRAQMSEGG